MVILKSIANSGHESLKKIPKEEIIGIMRIFLWLWELWKEAEDVFVRS